MTELATGTPVWVKRCEDIPGTGRHGGDIFDTWSRNDTRKWLEKGVVCGTGTEKDGIRIYTEEQGYEDAWRCDLMTHEEHIADMENEAKMKQRGRDCRKREAARLQNAAEKGPGMFKAAWQP